MSLPIEVLTGGVRGGTSILYAALGETISERAGVINLGTEGSMLCGALAAYASAFGQAFQLADDLLDAEGDAAAMGKAAAKDAGRGKATLVALLGVDAARARLRALVDDAEAALAPFGDRAVTLKQTARFIASRRA